ncbi:MAG: mechanosensitive ion channel [Deltaproteobacteria bacterium]|nr:mechanosensitive ion channel [Deltaproteobacteria bacterium]
MPVFIASISWMSLLFIALLSLYRLASKRSPKLPELPLTLLIVYFCIRFFSGIAQSLVASTDWGIWLTVTESIVLSWAVVRLVFAGALEIPLKVRGKKPFPRITRDFILFLCYAILVFIVLRLKSNINLVSLVTTSAALTVVLGFAAQSLLSNFFFGLVLQLERPIDIGDWIQVGDFIGMVTSINWKSTKLLTRDQIVVYIPNSEITSRIFLNYSKPDRKVRSKITIGLDYDAPPDLVKKVILEVLHRHQKVLKHPAPDILLISFGDSAILYEIRFWHENFSNEPKIKSEINILIWYALRRHNIAIPFPIRNIQHAHEERAHQEATREHRCKDMVRMFEKVPVLSPLSPGERAQLAHQVKIEPFGEGEIIVRQHEAGDSLYIITKGTCEVLLESQLHQFKQVAVLKKGDFFGEMSLLTGEPRSATVRAIEDTEVIVIQKDVFSEILSANSGISEYLGQVLAERQQQLAGQAGDGSALPVATPGGFIQKIKSFFGIS